MRARKLTVAAAAAAIGALALAGIAPASGGEPGRAAASKTTMLYDQAPGFFPGTLSVKAGTTLVWKADKSNTTKHTVTLDKSAAPKKAKYFDSGDMGPGKTYKQTLKVKGSYLLYCKIHGGMFQTVKVR